MMKPLCLVLSLLSLCFGLQAAEYSWQQQHATVLETGDLQWKPQPFEFKAGKSVRYIDYAKGDDNNNGKSKASAWKHHPWDANATANAKASTGIHSYVFKRGVIYRGVMITKGNGQPGNPIRLTSDPSWGEGKATIQASQTVRGWQRGAHAKTPDGDKVWMAKLEYSPRVVCVVYPDGSIKRLTLARTPNWDPNKDPDDPYKDLFRWERKNLVQGWKLPKGKAGKTKVHFGTDAANLTEAKDYYEGALIWSEWGVVMGAPYATPVRSFDEKTKTIGFEGPWHGDSAHVHPNCRYWLEDKPHYLDQAGEFWFDKQGEGGTLYVRLPGDADPNSVTVEAAQHRSFIDSKGIKHLDVSGLHFRFGNVFWRLDARFFGGDVVTSGIRILGEAVDVNIHHNEFEYLTSAVSIKNHNPKATSDNVRVTDNVIRHTDHGGIEVSDGTGWGQKTKPGQMRSIKIMRNKLEDIGYRPHRPNGHMAIEVAFAQNAEIAGNIIKRCGAAGIFVHGGKTSGATYDAPFVRFMIHHNKVKDSMLISNDWGAIETWQGGPFYVFNNVVDNPVGPMHWAGHRWTAAYYMDGSYKNYFFNNIALGKANDMNDKLRASAAAFQNIHGHQTVIFNNSASTFRLGSNRQNAVAGRNKYLGNVFHNISEYVFKHGKSGIDPNAKDVGQEADHFAYELNAYSSNVFSQISGKLGPFEAAGGDYTGVTEFAAAMGSHKALASDTGIQTDKDPYAARTERDLRLAANSAAIDNGVKMFVPMSLYGTVGEYHFTPNQKDPSNIIDEGWYLKTDMKDRTKYHDAPTYPLQGVNVALADFTDSPTEDWAKGAVTLNGKDQYLVLKHISAKAKASPKASTSATTKVIKKGDYEVTAPSAITPGIPFTIKVKVNKATKGHTLCFDLNWLKPGGFGGWNAFGGRAKINGPGPYTFTCKPVDKPNLTSFNLNLYVSPDGKWNSKVSNAAVDISKAKNSNAKPKAPFSPHISTQSFVVETYFKTSAGAKGTLIQKEDDTTGWGILLNEQGKATLTAGGKTLTSNTTLNDGSCHHLLVEADRKTKTLTIYVDGKRDASTTGIDSSVNLANTADMTVGGGPGQEALAMTVDFLRIAQGSLADSQTSIDELYAWQFDGPFLRDFTGFKPTGKRDAGALERR